MATRRRLDAELVRRRLAPSRAAAARLIDDHQVLVAGALALKSSRLTSAGEAIELVGEAPRFVSRGGEKLDAALDRFDIDVTGLRVLDAGASTGGFTDCCLQRGAALVYAFDVGHAQLHERIRANNRVVVRERFNVRSIVVDDIGEPCDVVVADLSFISLSTVLPALVDVLRPGGVLIALVKPQFEAGRQEVSKGKGIVTDPATHAAVCERIGSHIEALEADIIGWMTSPITGAEGNTEFLVAARRRSSLAGSGGR